MGPLLFSIKQQHHPQDDEDNKQNALLPVVTTVTNETAQALKENQQQKIDTATTTATTRNDDEMGNAMSSNPCMNGNEPTKKSILLLSPLTGTEAGAEAEAGQEVAAATLLSEGYCPSSQCEGDGVESLISLFKHEEQPQLTTSLSAASCPTVETSTSSPQTKRRGRGWSARHSQHDDDDDDVTGRAASDSNAATSTVDNCNNAASRHSWPAGEHHRSFRRRRKGHHHENIISSNNINSMFIGHHHRHHHFGLHQITAFMAHMSTSSSKGTSKIVRKTGKAFARFLTHFEEFLFPKSPLAHELAARSGNGNGHTAFAPAKVRGGVLMEGCASPVEHYARIQHVLQGMYSLHGADGLRFCDLEYRLVHCPAHETVQEQEQHLQLLLQQQEQQLDNHPIDYSGISTLDEIQEHYQIPISNDYKNNVNNKLTHVSSLPDLQGTGTDDFYSSSLYNNNNNNNSRLTSVKSSQSLMSMRTVTSRASGWTCTTAGLDASHPPLTPLDDSEHCHLCSHRLVYIPTNTIIDTTNRKKYIADGDMYEAIARCCQEYAQDVMCAEGNLEWVTIEQQQQQQQQPAESDDGVGNENHRHRHHHFKPARAPIRALVNSQHPLIQTSASSPSCILAAHDNEQEEEEQQQQQRCRDCRFESRRPTMIIATGKGKVMAGIFSRQHLMCTSLESATALPIVKECKSRHLNMVIPDPNVHGDANGYDTFSKTMAKLFASWETNEQEPREGNDDGGQADDDSEQQLPPLQSRDLYILSHSASGAQVARYLLEKGDAYLPHIRAIAFTDSTHNIQWCKQSSKSSSSARTAAVAGSKNAKTSVSSSSCNNKKDNSIDGSSSSSSRNTQHHGDDLSELLQSSKSVYFRCANERRDGSRWYLHAAGDVVKTDDFWKHRFGAIQTYWAGTNEHSLTNWYAHAHIWRHFDAFLDPLATYTRTSPSQEQQQEYQIPSSLLNVVNASDEENENDDGYSNDFALDLDEEDDICFDKIACTAPMTI